VRKSFTVALVSAALCFPSIALADHGEFDDAFTGTGETMMDFNSMEACEEARAEERREQTAQFKGQGRAFGQANKEFNQRFQCVEQSDDTFDIEDSED
jgi:hypothetical protein